MGEVVNHQCKPPYSPNVLCQNLDMDNYLTCPTLPAVGQIITYEAFGGSRRTIRVTNAEEDIKNGRPGFDGVVISGPDEGMTAWGYTDQIV